MKILRDQPVFHVLPLPGGKHGNPDRIVRAIRKAYQKIRPLCDISTMSKRAAGVQYSVVVVPAGFLIQRLLLRNRGYPIPGERNFTGDLL